MNVVDISLVFTEDENRRWSLLEAFKEVYNSGIFLDILDFLNDIKICCSSSPHIDSNWFHKGILRKILNLLGHSSRKKKGLPLILEMVKNLLDVILKSQINQPICFI